MRLAFYLKQIPLLNLVQDMESTIVQPHVLGDQCPYCHEPIMGNYLFCRSCGASQIVPEFDRAFCPFCGLRVSKRQEFCHECCGYLRSEEQVNQEPVPLPILQRCVKKVSEWVNRNIHAAFLVGGLICAMIIYLALTKTAIVDINLALNDKKLTGQETLTVKQVEQDQAAYLQPPLPLASDILGQSSRTQVTQMLNQIRKAQLNKDIDLFMSSFSPNYHELAAKRKEMLRIWQRYNFVSMSFNIEDVQEGDKNIASVKVNWQIEAKNQFTNEIKQFTKSYLIYLSKEGDKWLIKDMLNSPQVFGQKEALRRGHMAVMLPY
jgi:hypothetical protein